MGRKELQASICDVKAQVRQYEVLIEEANEAIAVANKVLKGPNDLDGKPWTSQTKAEIQAGRDFYVRELGSMQAELETHRDYLNKAEALLRDAPTDY
jgi:hypothetical protein